MTHDNHGWDDDEETIINFTPKQRTAPAKNADEIPLSAGDGPHGRGPGSNAAENADGAVYPPVPQVPPLMSLESPLLGIDPSLNGVETPPASGLYGTQAPQSRGSAMHGDSSLANRAPSGGQDPYLTFSGMQDALPPAGTGAQLPSLPPLPPLPGETQMNGRQDERSAPEPIARESPSVPSLPGFGVPVSPVTPAHQEPPISSQEPPIPPAEWRATETKQPWWEAPPAATNDPASSAVSAAPAVKQPWWQTPSTPDALPSLPPLPAPTVPEVQSGVESAKAEPCSSNVGAGPAPASLDSEETVIDAPVRRSRPEPVAESAPEPEMTSRVGARTGGVLSDEPQAGFASQTPSVPALVTPEVPDLDSDASRASSPTSPVVPPIPGFEAPVNADADEDIEDSGEFQWPQAAASTPDAEMGPQATVNLGKPGTPPALLPIETSSDSAAQSQLSPTDTTASRNLGPETEALTPELLAKLQNGSALVTQSNPAAETEAPELLARQQAPSTAPAEHAADTEQPVAEPPAGAASPGFVAPVVHAEAQPETVSAPEFDPRSDPSGLTAEADVPGFAPPPAQYAAPSVDILSPGFTSAAVLPAEPGTSEHAPAEILPEFGQTSLETPGIPVNAEPPAASASSSQLVQEAPPVAGGAPAKSVDIDPPTVMDVPLVARRALDEMHPRPAPSSESGAEAKPSKKTGSKVTATTPEAQPAEVAPEPIASVAQIADQETELVDTEPDTDLEWAALCEAAVTASPSVPPLPVAIPGPDIQGAPDVPPVAASGAIPNSAAPAAVPDASQDGQGESEMEKTNLHISSRTTSAVADIAWLAILKSPTADIHQIFRLDALRMELGRTFDAPIFVDDKTVSSRHAAIRYERVEDRFEFVLYDLASTNGSFVNGANVHMAVLKDDDRIRVGETELVFKKVEDPPGLTQ